MCRWLSLAFFTGHASKSVLLFYERRKKSKIPGSHCVLAGRRARTTKLGLTTMLTPHGARLTCHPRRFLILVTTKFFAQSVCRKWPLRNPPNRLKRTAQGKLLRSPKTCVKSPANLLGSVVVSLRGYPHS
jgi:hypothetical protein